MQEDRTARATMATAAASAGERGVSGISVAAIQQEYANRRDEFNADVEYNRKAADQEIQLQMQGFNTEGQSQINDIKSHYLRPSPSPFTPIAELGKSAFYSYDQFLRIPSDTGSPVDLNHDATDYYGDTR